MVLDINDIQKILPHRPPMLLVDRIIELEPFKSATGIKNVTMNEPHFLGHFRVSFTSLNPHKLIGVQYEDFHVDEAVYHKEIAPARTIAYEKEIQALREMGLGLGGSLENVIVYNDEGWLNPLHFEDELVRHKILDVIGDLRLAGIIRGHVIAVASGHALNTQLAKQIAAAYEHQ